MHFSASQLGTRPASSISFMVRVPGVKISFTVCGHSINQIIGTIVLRLDVQTPTMPITQLSEYMTQFGIFLTSWQTWVGCLPMCLMIAPQQLRHYVRSEVMQSHWLVPARPIWIGENSPAPPGMPKDLCWRMPASFYRIFLGVFVVICMLWSRSSILFIFSPSKRSV